MKTLSVTLKGLSPIILHSCQCANPLHPLAKEMKKITSKRGKTDEDHAKLSDLEWQAGLYWRDDIGVFIPCENIEATLQNGAKSFKKGKDIEKYCMVETLYPALDYGEKLTLDQLRDDLAYRDVRIMSVQKAKILRTRPRFDTWRLKFDLAYNDTKIDIETIVQALDYAGSYVGLCDSRPKYGKFTAIIEEMA